MGSDTAVEALRRVTLFRDLGTEEIGALAAQVVRRRHARGQIIFSQGDPGDGLYVVTRGHVSINRQSIDGNELILGIMSPGEYFGELAILDEEPRSATATAIEACHTLFLSRDAFRQFLASHPAAVPVCMAVIVGMLRRLTDLADELALLDVRTRLARRLLQLARRGIVTSGQVEPERSFRITQQQLANMLGATRESVNKHLRAFAAEGILQLDHGTIHILDLPRLEECAVTPE
jgi:CRP-like cAMP-binding protein